MRSPISLLLATSLAAGPVTARAGVAQDPLKQQQMEYAKQQFAEAEALLAEGKFAEAVQKYETAYRYAPEFHALNYNIGVAAMQAGDCVKAKHAFQRFLDLVPEHEMRKDAQEQLIEIERSGCAATPPPQPGQAGGPVTDEEDAPVLTSRRQEREEAATAEAAAEDKPRKMNGLMLAGVGLMAGGGALALSGGIAGIIAGVNAKKLQELDQPGATGFSPNSYADDKVFRMDTSRKNAGITAAILAPLGGALLVTGIALFVVGAKKKKKEAKAEPAGEAPTAVRLEGIGPVLHRGGGGLSATVRF
ncbi:MAG: hypothetical protein D6705_04885 [Deltaproteobacteria bacterium]|nr:MAG: hypothetical protein D6705_04885 [Deltaproteobacteria bacterium]